MVRLLHPPPVSLAKLNKTKDEKDERQKGYWLHGDNALRLVQTRQLPDPPETWSLSNQYGPPKVPMIKDTLLKTNQVRKYLILPQLSKSLGNGLQRCYGGCTLVSICQQVGDGEIRNRGGIAPLDFCWPSHLLRHFLQLTEKSVLLGFVRSKDDISR